VEVSRKRGEQIRQMAIQLWGCEGHVRDEGVIVHAARSCGWQRSDSLSPRRQRAALLQTTCTMRLPRLSARTDTIHLKRTACSVSTSKSCDHSTEQVGDLYLNCCCTMPNIYYSRTRWAVVPAKCPSICKVTHS
jgi:hypothetical protein